MSAVRKKRDSPCLSEKRDCPSFSGGFGPFAGGSRESGFTLIEMLVALAIFSLAALALLRLGGATATNSARLNDQAIAMIVARNLAVETLTDPQPPAFGSSAGALANAGRRWRWTRSVARSPEARIQQIEIAVEPEAGGPGRARLTIFRRGPA
jgi:general secretion pathway protein I